MKALPQIDGNNPKWRGAHLIVIPFDPRMKAERDQLADQLVGQGYYIFVGRKEDVERFILKEGEPRDDPKEQRE